MAMRAQVLKQEVIANNLANADTVAYSQDKAVFSSFHDVLISMCSPSSFPKTLGGYSAGTVLQDVRTIHEVGPLETTGHPLDIALREGDYLSVQTAAGTRYTRRGDLQISPEGYLTVAGFRVLGDSQPVRVGDCSGPYVSEDAYLMSGEDKVAALDIVHIKSASLLTKVGNSLYEAEAGSVSKSQGAAVLQGVLEKSAVDPVAEMVNLIYTMRAYEAAQKAVQSHDEALGQAVNKVGAV